MKLAIKLSAFVLTVLLIAAGLVGCGGETALPPPPTISTFFTGTAIPTIRPTFTPDGFGLPTQTPRPTPDISYRNIVIFDDEVSDNWRLDADRMDFEITNRVVYSGSNAIRVSPEDDFAAFLVVVDEFTQIAYPKESIWGYSFYLSGGSGFLGHEDYALAAQGSNFYEYWLAFDESARVGEGPIFSESLLYYFQLNNAIPPNTWVQIEVALDDLIFDPPYSFFTGFYMKNDFGVSDTFYIDQIELILVEYDGIDGLFYLNEGYEFAEDSDDTAEEEEVDEETADELFPTETTILYGDMLNPGWTLETDRVTYEQTTEFVHSGDSALKVEPQDGFSAFLVVTPQDIEEPYLREDVVGYRFYLSGGENGINVNDLGLAVQGSKINYYWAPFDDSALTEAVPAFSESRLFNFGIDDDIRPGEWVLVEVFLDDLVFDPNYDFFTGFYIKNDPLYIEPYYIDTLQLITRANESETIESETIESDSGDSETADEEPAASNSSEG